MKKITIEGTKYNFSQHGFSLMEKIGGVYTTLTPFHSCRSFMCDSLFNLKNPTYKIGPLYPFRTPDKELFDFNYKKGDIIIGIQFPTDAYKKQFISNISNLHIIEETAKVKKSIVYETQYSNVLVVQGSKYWKDSCWKMMLYTFYLKTFAYKDPKTCDKEYWKHLTKDKETKLLSKIKIQRELFDPSVYGPNNNKGHHDREGFVSICSGKNKPMAKLLGVDY